LNGKKINIIAENGKNMDLDEDYWEKRYRSSDTPWDIGYASDPIVNYFAQVENKEVKILIPGAGNAYEAEFLHKSGFKNVTVLDLASAPLKRIQNSSPDFPENNLVKGDFFQHKGNYNYIIEQTFFCAIDPAMRGQYAKKCFELLKPGGKLVGLLFDDKLNSDFPPYGGTREEYIRYFSPYFKFRYFDPAINSIKPRAGRELFICFEKPVRTI
jgi:methyl halide transferase